MAAENVIDFETHKKKLATKDETFKLSSYESWNVSELTNELENNYKKILTNFERYLSLLRIKLIFLLWKLLYLLVTSLLFFISSIFALAMGLWYTTQLCINVLASLGLSKTSSGLIVSAVSMVLLYITANWWLKNRVSKLTADL